jgi:LmbE family N-acetylglucosaminyl deacetylase
MDFTPILSSLSSSFSTGNTLPKDNFPLTVMILSPHPDDECIVGSLALRLMFENNAHVVNVAVTLGSKVERQKARLKELEGACELLEMELVVLSDKWPAKEKELKSLIQKYQPNVILAPHVKDHHPTHIKTGQLLKKCLRSLKKINTLVVWTEFWGQNPKPNVLIEVSMDILELQMNALLMHKGEIKRNPYHLRLPAWMMDNVRRGSEIISGSGSEASSMAFGILYEWQLIKNGKKKKLHLPTSTLSRHADLGSLIQSLLD